MKRRARATLLLVVLAVGVAALGPLAIAWRESDDGATLPADVPGRLVDVGGRRVHVVERGTGPALLLVHGFGASTHDFEEFVLEPLAESHRVVAIDLFGFGWSERRDDFDYGWTLWSEQIVGTMDALGIARASIVGHSMGGAVAAVLAARHPERLERLVLADAFYPPEPQEISWVFRARVRGTRWAMLRYVRDPAKLAALRAALLAIATATLVLHGRNDRFVRYAAMERATPAIRGARIVPLSGDHFPFRDDAATFVREIAAFLTPSA